MIDSAGREETLTRNFARLVAICGLCIGGIWVLELVTRPTQPVWWSIFGYIILLLAMFSITVGARAMRMSALRAIMGLSVVLGFALQLLTFPAMRGTVSPVVWEVSWMFAGVYLCFIALQLDMSRPQLTVNLIAAVTATFPALSFWATYDFWPLHLWVVTLVQFTNVGFPMLLLEVRARMSQYGVRQDRWRLRVTESAAARERLREERRLGRILHDNILGVMNQVMWSGSEITDDLRASVREALALLHRAERPGESEMSVREIRTVVEAAMREANPDVDCFIVEADGSLPENVVATFLAALMEALRNSAKHAPGSQRAVCAELAGDCVNVVVSDDGPGFVPESVSPNRLGVSRSISERMRDLPGGAARITSAPGEGTVVILTWKRP
ncbi:MULTISPECIES: sensor histidine kinase [unclassified Leucobacter]|uniref:sensor histidine kinase n=1 Tax=unclassified Leucobacter TaxID=2621730 RepID=UPI00165E0E41|nr:MULTISPECIES: ATP-binding protein [unclassified Leucobacter]MBC9926600.1 hypothetical protein [Leucobacter sp. cx-169]